jgi:predicted lipoprotein with Yx(FWY)xxD motif/plastocyanin
MKTRMFGLLVLILSLLLAACSSGAAVVPAASLPKATTAVQPAAAQATVAQPTAEAQKPAAGSAAGTPVDLGQSASLGQFLVDAKGMTLYLYTKDTPNTSNCYDACAQAWPPLQSSAAPVAGKGVTAGMLGTTTRKDGSLQVTYNGWPLYYFFKDKQPGDVTGQGNKGVWFVITPSGEKVETALPAAAPQATAAPTMTMGANDNSQSDYGSSSATAPAPAAHAGLQAAVTISNFAFDPKVLTVKVGATVTWTNLDGAPHKVVADNGEFTSDALQQGDTFSFTFTKAGTYPYYCAFHGGKGGQGMSGQVVVTP